MQKIAEVLFCLIVIAAIGYLLLEAATAPCVGASYCDKVNGK